MKCILETMPHRHEAHTEKESEEKQIGTVFSFECTELINKILKR